MATAKQACGALDAVLRLPDETARVHADLLRGAGHLPSTQGKPAQIESSYVALLLLSLVVGSTRQAPEYAALRTTAGRRLSDVLAGYIDKPDDFFELRLDLLSPSGVLTYRGPDRGMRVVTFNADEPQPRATFERHATISAAVITHLAQTIAAAPPVRVGRRRHAERFRTD